VSGFQNRQTVKYGHNCVAFGTKNRCPGEGQQRFRSQLSLWGAAIVRCEKLVAEAGDSSGSQRKRNVHC
jgi:hypothetical protein